MSARDDFVFATLIAHHQDPAAASRALAMAEADALRRAADEMDAHCEQYGVFGVGDRLRRIADKTETGWNRPPGGAGEKSSPAGAVATPGPTGRVAQLLDAIRTARGQWPVHRAVTFYRDNIPGLRSMPPMHLRKVARGDLRDLAAWGHLLRHEEPGRQYYTLKTRKGGTA